MIFSIIGKILATAGALVIGLVEGAIFFSDPGPGETMIVRLVMALFLAVPGGAFFGYNFRRLWFLAVLNAWVPIMFIFSSFEEIAAARPGELGGFAALWVPVVASLAAGWFGSRLKAAKKRAMLSLVVGAGAAAFVAAIFYLDIWVR